MIKARKDWILLQVVPEPTETVTESGLVVPNAIPGGSLIAVGRIISAPFGLDLQEGTLVNFNVQGAMKFRVDGEEFMYIKEDYIVGVLSE